MAGDARSPGPDPARAPTGPRAKLASRLRERTPDIEAWLRAQRRQAPPPLYCSVDLRNAGFKLAPVDTDLFPAGFNDLNLEVEAIAVNALKSALARACPTAKGLLLVPENHTRNKFYLESVATLFGLVQKAGYEVRVGTLIPEIRLQTTMTLGSGEPLAPEPIPSAAVHV